ncbi:MAG: hypothetical protein V2A67_00340 [Bacteroidota bacterium]
MRSLFSFILLGLLLCNQSFGQDQKKAGFLSSGDMQFLGELTRAVVDSSRILPGKDLPPAIKSFGPNRSGITLIRPGGRNCYPSFWIRDYAMSLESGFISKTEQRDMLIYTAQRQADQSWITANGSLVPVGSIPDHIRINDGLPVFFPGTYDYVQQGGELWKMPPYDDNYFFIHMAWFYLNESGDFSLLRKDVNGINLIDRLEAAFTTVPGDPDNQMVTIDQSFQTVDFGFRDIISMTGNVCFGSILKYRAAIELSDFYHRLRDQGKEKKYRDIAGMIRKNLVPVFAGERGFFRASTGSSSQPDVWATAFAVFSGILDEPVKTKACDILAEACRNGTISMEGQIRHVPVFDDYSDATSWEISGSSLNTYQNGAFWGTPTGWVCYAVYQVDPKAAVKLAKEYIDSLRKTDYRTGLPGNGGPYECIFPPMGYKQNPVYMTTVTCPYAAFRRIQSDE